MYDASNQLAAFMRITFALARNCATTWAAIATLTSTA